MENLKNNIDDKVIKDFGLEWSEYDHVFYSKKENETTFKKYCITRRIW